jgi:hypothetical protein
VLASVFFNFGPAPLGVRPNEEIQVTLNGDNLSVNVRDSRQFALVSFRQDSAQMNGGILNMATTYNVQLARIDDVLRPVTQPVSDFTIRNDVLTFTVGQIYYAESFLPRIRIQQGGTNIIDRDLSFNEYQLVNLNGRTQVVVELLSLGVQLRRSENANLKVTSQLDARSILNPNTVPVGQEQVGRATVTVQ